MFHPYQMAQDHYRTDSGRLLSARLSALPSVMPRRYGLTEAEKPPQRQS